MQRAVFLFLLFIVGAFCRAETLYVDAAGPNDPGTGTGSDPFRTIQAAIDEAAASGADTVEVRPGVYAGPGNYDISPRGLDITVTGTDPHDWSVVASTVINCGQAGRGFIFDNGEGPACRVTGFTVHGGLTDGSGAGVYCDGSSPSISHCVIRSCRAGWGGGAAFCFNSGPSFRNCIIAANTAGGAAGGLMFSGCDGVEVVNCTVSGNTANWSQGKAVHFFGSTGSVSGCILWGNGSEELYSDVPDDITVSYSDVAGGWPGDGNIDTDPLFAAFDAGGSSVSWDLHLKSEYGRGSLALDEWVTDTQTSLCIDAADPAGGVGAEPWPNGGRLNMGAYGGTAEASMNGNPADFDIDGDVDFADYASLAGLWDEVGQFVEDLDGDGRIGTGDVRIFSENWLL
jgi:hypothetical protein